MKIVPYHKGKVSAKIIRYNDGGAEEVIYVRESCHVEPDKLNSTALKFKTNNIGELADMIYFNVDKATGTFKHETYPGRVCLSYISINRYFVNGYFMLGEGNVLEISGFFRGKLHSETPIRVLFKTEVN